MGPRWPTAASSLAVCVCVCVFCACMCVCSGCQAGARRRELERGRQDPRARGAASLFTRPRVAPETHSACLERGLPPVLPVFTRRARVRLFAADIGAPRPRPVKHAQSPPAAARRGSASDRSAAPCRPARGPPPSAGERERRPRASLPRSSPSLPLAAARSARPHRPAREPDAERPPLAADPGAPGAARPRRHSSRAASRERRRRCTQQPWRLT